MQSSFTLACGAIVFATACGGSEPACIERETPAVVVEIRDAVDGRPLAQTARGVVREGGFEESLRPYGSVGNSVLISRSAAQNRPGMYSVVVSHEGYLDWRAEGVRVPRDTCGVQTVELEAPLQKRP